MTEAVPPAAKAAVLRRRAVERSIAIDTRGSSMGRTIPDGARVLVVGGERPRRGELWAFVADDGTVIVHRFRREHTGLLWFQGDRNPSVDRPVEPEMLVGRVVAADVNSRRTRFGRFGRLRGRLMLDWGSLLRRVSRLRS